MLRSPPRPVGHHWEAPLRPSPVLDVPLRRASGCGASVAHAGQRNRRPSCRVSGARSPPPSAPGSCQSSPRSRRFSATYGYSQVPAGSTSSRQRLRSTSPRGHTPGSAANCGAPATASSGAPGGIGHGTQASAASSATALAATERAIPRGTRATRERSAHSPQPQPPPSSAQPSEASAPPRTKAPTPLTPPASAAARIDALASTTATDASAGNTGGLRVVLTAKLASRLLADLLEAYRSSDKLEDARSVVGRAWGFEDADEMTRCIEAQANASYLCGVAPQVA